MIGRVTAALRDKGLAEVLRLAFKTTRRQVEALTPAARARRRRLLDFDRRWGTETASMREASRLSLGADALAHAVRYQTTPVDSLLERLQSLNLDFGSTSFIDFGCGKGRVVLTAAQLPFRSVTGVELSSELCRTAMANLTIMERHGVLRTPVDIIEADARAFTLPPGNLVAYFYNPFGAVVLEPIVRRLEDAGRAGARVVVLYVDPRHRSVFDQTGLWRAEQQGSTCILEFVDKPVGAT